MHSPFFRRKALIALLPGLCPLAQAETASTFNVLEPVVVTGTYAPNPSFDLPYSIDTVDRQQIADGQLGVNLSEALNRVPGLVVQNRQNYAQDLQISSRGYGARAAFGIRGIKLLSDGIPA
ncbi:MAG: TonB-dependent receptor plug domain-containing protein, partial [Pseudomonas sp.]